MIKIIKWQFKGCTKWNTDNTTNSFLDNAVKQGICFGLHGNLHIYIGGQVASLASPNDPLFFLLHNWVDLMWARYQKEYGDHTFPEQYLDIDIMLGWFGMEFKWSAARDVMNTKI